MKSDTTMSDPLEAAVDILDQPPPNEEQEEIQDELKMQYHYGREYGKQEWMTMFQICKQQEYLNGITITFREILRIKYTEKVLKEMVKSCFRDIYKEYKQKYDVRIFLIPEYDKSGNYHYHGIIRGFKRNQLAQLKRKLSQHIGYCKIEGNIKNIYNWLQYCCKDIDEDFKENHIIMSKRLLP